MGEEKYRAQQAADSILGDERLTAGLEDEAADFLLEWGLALATAAAADSSSPDDEDDTKMSSRIKAVKRMLRYVNEWLQKRQLWDPVERDEKLSKIFVIAKLAYGNDYDYEILSNSEEPAGLELEVFLSQAKALEGNSIEVAFELRQLLEGNGQEQMYG